MDDRPSFASSRSFGSVGFPFDDTMLVSSNCFLRCREWMFYLDGFVLIEYREADGEGNPNAFP